MHNSVMQAYMYACDCAVARAYTNACTHMDACMHAHMNASTHSVTVHACTRSVIVHACKYSVIVHAWTHSVIVHACKHSVIVHACTCVHSSVRACVVCMRAQDPQSTRRSGQRNRPLRVIPAGVLKHTFSRKLAPGHT